MFLLSLLSLCSDEVGFDLHPKDPFCRFGDNINRDFVKSDLPRKEDTFPIWLLIIHRMITSESDPKHREFRTYCTVRVVHALFH